MSCIIRDELHKLWDANPDKVFLEDEENRWKGLEIQEKSSVISKIIEKYTLPGMGVGLCFTNSATAALCFISCIEADRIPIFIDYLDFNNRRGNDHWGCLLVDDELPITWPIHRPCLQINRNGSINKILKSKEMKPSIFSSHEQNQFPPDNQPKIFPDETLAVLYTSGSTGEPKEVLVPTQGVLLTVEELRTRMTLNPETIAPIVTPLCYSMGLNTQFLPTLLSGGKCILINARLELGHIYKRILQSEGTFISLIGDLLTSCWEEMLKRNLPPATKVKDFQMAGGNILIGHINMAMKLFPNARIHKGYGLTEGIRVSMIHSGELDFFSESMGQPLPFVEIEIQDENGKPLASNEIGEILVKGPNVQIITQDNRSTLAHSFRDGFLKTGDLGYLNKKGHLVVLGRKDGVFKLFGKRISGFLFEQIVTQVNPQICGSKCILVTDETSQQQRIILYIEYPLPENYNALLEMISQLEIEFKKYSYYPKNIIFIQKLPRTPNGKIHILKLRTLWHENIYKYLEPLKISSVLKYYYYSHKNVPLNPLKESKEI